MSPKHIQTASNIAVIKENMTKPQTRKIILLKPRITYLCQKVIFFTICQNPVSGVVMIYPHRSEIH